MTLKFFTSWAELWQNESGHAMLASTAQPGRVVSVFVKCAVLTVTVGVLWNSTGLGQVASFKSGVVKITVSSPALKTGAGFVIARTSNVTYIVTAAHVVERADKISVQFFSAESAPVSARTRHVEAGNPQGMALLEVSGQVPAERAAARAHERVQRLGERIRYGDRSPSFDCGLGRHHRNSFVAQRA